jgi:pyrimidine-nucleoside phosphorylase/thymidine phosphorylase
VRAADIIVKKRDGETLSAAEIRYFVSGFASGEIADYQATALAMAICFRGMDTAETLSLTEAMMESGEVLDLSELPGPRADKHSTGGVGDKTSLVLAPLAASCGVTVPMISGRGLGHTGGTLDKLESIAGFRVDLSLAQLRSVLEKAGLVLTGQTPEIAPVDRRLYALRDVTGTVESPALIAASIMSKKLAEGIDALILDVKTGDGAFTPDLDAARSLARLMVEIGEAMGKRVAALVTDMDQPLGRRVGNALEVFEAIETLKGRGPKDLESLSVELAARMLVLARVEPGLLAARGRVREALLKGHGLRKLEQVIELQGGDPRVCEDPGRLPSAAEEVHLDAEQDGRVSRIASRAVGQAAMLLGAGRETVNSPVDPAVGVVLHKKVGDPVVERETLATLHVNDRQRLDEAMALLRSAIQVHPRPSRLTPLIRDVIDASSLEGGSP